MADKPSVVDTIHDAAVKAPRRQRRGLVKKGAGLVGSGLEAAGNLGLGAIQGIIGIMLMFLVKDGLIGSAGKLFGNMFKGFTKRAGINIRDGANKAAETIAEHVPGVKTAMAGTEAGLRKAGDALRVGSDATGADNLRTGIVNGVQAAGQGIATLYRDGLAWDAKTSAWIKPPDAPANPPAPASPNNLQARQHLRYQSNPLMQPQVPGSQPPGSATAPTITKITVISPTPVVTPYSSTAPTPATGP